MEGRSDSQRGLSAQPRIASLISAEVETKIAEKELEQWRSSRQTGLDRFKPYDQPSTPSSRDYLTQHYCDFLPSPKPFSPLDQYSSPISTRSGASLHANCITKLEHELKVREIEDAHSRELEAAKGKLVDGLNERMREFEDNCIEQYQAKVRSLESTHVSNADVIELQAKLDAFSLNEEIITRRFEGKLARADLALQECKMRLGREQSKVADLTEELERRDKEVRDLGERLKKLQEDDGAKEAIEQERKSRERLANDYKRVAMELAEEKLRNKRDYEGDAKRHIKSLQQKNEQLQRELQTISNELRLAQATIQASKKAENLERRPSEPSLEKHKERKGSEAGPHVEDLRLFYEQKLMSVSDELLQWKNKSISLVTRFYPVLKQLKSDNKRMRDDVERTKARMESEVKSHIEALRLKPTHDKPRRDTSRKRS